MNPPYGSELTDREIAVLDYMSRGLSNPEIGDKLFITEDTVETHARRLFRRLGARDRAHAVRLGFERGVLVSDDDPGPVGFVGADPESLRAVARALMVTANRQEVAERRYPVRTAVASRPPFSESSTDSLELSEATS
jgi:DNA-binding CsgD family transcriptional regulator